MRTESSTALPTVLLVGNFLSATSGTKPVCEELAERISAAGWSVLTTSSRPGRGARLADMVGSIYKWRRAYQVAQVDVFSGNAFVWAEWACAVLRRLGKPYVLTLHGGNLPEFAAREPKRVKRLLKSAYAVTAPSHFLRTQLSSCRQDIRFLPNGFDVSNYPYQPREQIHRKVVWLRSFHSLYNPSLAPRMLAALSAHYPDFELVMIGGDKGDGSLAATVQTVEQLGLSQRVKIEGSVRKHEVPRRMNEGDLYINTTNVDNTPVTVVEAMACGLCVISTNVGGMPYLVQDGEDGLLVPPDDPEAMANAIRRVVEDPALAASLSRNARRKVEAWDWSQVLPQWGELLMSATRASA